MYRKIAIATLLALGLGGCATDSSMKSEETMAEKVDCKTMFKKVDGAIAGSYTKMSPDKFFKVGDMRDAAMEACKAGDMAGAERGIADVQKAIGM